MRCLYVVCGEWCERINRGYLYVDLAFGIVLYGVFA